MCSRCGVKGHGKEDCNNNVIKCHQCKESHKAGCNSCIEYKYQQEIFSIQAKERVPRNQTRAILERRSPRFKLNSYAAVAKSSTITIAIKITSNRSNNNTDNHTTPRSPNLGNDEDGGTSEVEVVCRSPTSGVLFTTVVNLPDKAEQEVNLENRTSENSAIIRAEVKEIFDQHENKATEETAIEDMQTYEEELERATRKSRETKKMEEKRERRNRDRAGSDKERKRNRSANRESRSNSNDRRRQGQSKQRRFYGQKWTSVA